MELRLQEARIRLRSIAYRKLSRISSANISAPSRENSLSPRLEEGKDDDGAGLERVGAAWE